MKAQVQGAGEAEQAEGLLPGAGGSRQSGSTFPRAEWMSFLFSPIANRENTKKVLQSYWSCQGSLTGRTIYIFVLN